MKRIVLFFLLLFLAHTSFAIRVSSIYQAVVPVATQSQQERDKMLQQALAQVLVKVSGKKTVLDNANLKSHLANAPTLMQEYGYTSANPAATQMPYLLTVKFDPDGVNRLLRIAGVPIWGVERPLVVAWVDYEALNKPAEIIDSSSGNDIQNILKLRSLQRGIPLLLPVMDVTDLNQVTVSDIATMTAPNLLNAAKRYSNDGILIVRVNQQPTGFTAQAKLILGTDAWTSTASGHTLAEVMNSVVDSMAETLGIRYSTIVTNAVQTRLTLKITGITQETDFAELMRYLQHVTAVANAEPIKIAGSEVMLQISLRGTHEAFLQAISLDKKLTPVAGESTDNMLVYEWNH